MLSNLFGMKSVSPETSVIPMVGVEVLGREHSGKTGGRTMTFKLTQQGTMPSGLELSAQDPRCLVKLMNSSLATYRGLQKSGFTSTVEPDLIQYHLYEADRVRATLQLRESLGQLLTFTEESSESRLQEQFARHHKNLQAADVIHVYVSCPADDQPASLERFQYDLVILMTNLRMVLANWRSDRKLAVAVILSKPDGAYASAEEARAALTEDRLRSLFHRMVLLLEGSSAVGLASIFVTSSFGYGKARLLEVPSTTSGPQKGFSVLSDGEPEWILKEGETPSPHNLNGLIWWTLMAGLALKPAGSRGEEMARTASLLHEDLEAMDAWYIPLKCRGGR